MSFSDYIKQHLNYDLKGRGIIVLREVEIRHITGGKPGERIDLYVDAYVPGHDHTKIAILTVIIEVKGCWNKDVDAVMQTQLVERYLKDNSCNTAYTSSVGSIALNGIVQIIAKATHPRSIWRRHEHDINNKPKHLPDNLLAGF